MLSIRPSPRILNKQTRNAIRFFVYTMRPQNLCSEQYTLLDLTWFRLVFFLCCCLPSRSEFVGRVIVQQCDTQITIIYSIYLKERELLLGLVSRLTSSSRKVMLHTSLALALALLCCANYHKSRLPALLHLHFANFHRLFIHVVRRSFSILICIP